MFRLATLSEGHPLSPLFFLNWLYWRCLDTTKTRAARKNMRAFRNHLRPHSLFGE